MLNQHFWRQHAFTVAGYAGESKYLSPIQTYKCERCGEIISLPDCQKQTCKVLMSLGCTNVLTKVKWVAPIRQKATPEERRDYPAKKKKR